MRLEEIGEFHLIDRMGEIFGRRRAGQVPILGIGDDAAVWAGPSSGFAIATTDAMVEGTHFTAQTTDWYDLGWRAMVSNISDIAGMGGVPRYALSVLAAPGSLDLEDALQICRGMADIAERFGTVVVGGDTVSSRLTMISVTLVGETLPGTGPDGKPPLLSRHTARPGDQIAVTGVLGSSAGGLELLLGGSEVPESLLPLVCAHRRPVPRVAEGQILIGAGVRCGMDLSDGLAGDLVRICRASGVAARIDAEQVPADPLLSGAFGDRALGMAVSGGEDYELMCIAPPQVMDRAASMLAAHGTPLTVVGTIVDQIAGEHPVMVRDREGKLQPPPKSGWEHFTTDNDAAGA